MTCQPSHFEFPASGDFASVFTFALPSICLLENLRKTNGAISHRTANINTLKISESSHRVNHPRLGRNTALSANNRPTTAYITITAKKRSRSVTVYPLFLAALNLDVRYRTLAPQSCSRRDVEPKSRPFDEMIRAKSSKAPSSEKTRANTNYTAKATVPSWPRGGRRIWTIRPWVAQ
jgi:hypothetical protein